MLTIADLPLSMRESLGVGDEGQLRVINESPVNATYCLSSEDERFLVKWFHADEATGRARPLLLAMQRKVAKAGLAPMPLYLSQERGLYVEEWISPCIQPLTLLPDNAKMQHLAKALCLTHDLKITTSLNDLPAQWEHYMAVSGPAEKSGLGRQIQTLLPLYDQAMDEKEHLVFCHNDLSLNHIVDYETPVLIDWEYAATGNRFFDIGSAIKINRLNTMQQALLIECYADNTGLSVDLISERLHKYQPLLNFTYQLWYAAIKAHTNAR
ncbi:phosphotransferase [Alteromonas facilis]|uniref:phosphotransferase n=1 Tax=Alteromonas facilis TaxID=2048004 RepID=UPI000C290D92|nr:phosphotransferase [Alteromonas facilis]